MGSRWRWTLALALALLAGAAGVAAGRLRLERARLEYRLLAAMPERVASDPVLVRFAVAQGRALFEHHCAACHGSNMRGNRAIGAPDLTDSVWLYGDGSVYDIERTVMYGIRSGRSKTHNVTDMPAFGQRGMLSDAQIRDLVQYLLKLNGRPHEGESAEEGRALFYGKPDCGDCHGSDARGDSDYGAPDLTVNVWNNGGDPQSLYDSLYFGRHRMMPAWLGTLSLEQIRALAVYVYSRSHPPGRTATTGPTE
ncbi:MAG TPA: c-type cytochrome [Steroidobacteraceae bacterium]|nr:c-type cytochrome [Steroidobacteraceae bacterium]